MREFAPDRKLLEKAEALTEINRWEEAIPLFTRYLAQEPDSHRANCFLSACFYHLKNTKDALRYAETGIRFKPEDEWGHRLRSLALSMDKRHKEALVSAKEAVRLAPQEPLAVQRLMNAYLNRKMTREALQEGEKLRSLQPEKEDAFVTMGYILMESRRYKEAEDLFYQALKINPVSSTALNNLGVIYLRQNNEEKAFEFFQRAIQADPNDKLAQDNLKITVKYTPLWVVILIFLAIGVFFPPALIGLLIYFFTGYKKERRFRKLPLSVQMFIKSEQKIFKSFPNFLASKTTLQVTKAMFFVILITAVFSAVILLIGGISDSTSYLKEIVYFLGNLVMLSLVAVPFGVFLVLFEKQTKRFALILMMENEELKYVKRAELLIEVGRYREAIHELHKSLKYEPDNYDVLCQIALCYYNLDEPNAVLNWAGKAIKAEPENEWAYRLQSCAYKSQGNNRQALERAEISASKAPFSVYPLQVLAEAQISCFMLDAAKATAAKLLELAPENEGTYEICGQIAIKEEDWTKAEFNFQELLKINPNSFTAFNNLGTVYLDLSRKGWQFGRRNLYRQKAIQLFEQAIKLSPTEIMAQTNLKIAKNSKLFNYQLKIGSWISLVICLSLVIKIFAVLPIVFIELLELLAPYSSNLFVFGSNIYFLTLVILLSFLLLIYLITVNLSAKLEVLLNKTSVSYLLLISLPIFGIPALFNALIIYLFPKDVNLLIFLAEFFYIFFNILLIDKLYRNYINNNKSTR